MYVHNKIIILPTYILLIYNPIIDYYLIYILIYYLPIDLKLTHYEIRTNLSNFITTCHFIIMTVENTHNEV